ncbi:MAG: FHIPEP family type III secretion protein, partial [Anaerohalosphaera sp.]|nr:FHIPEP family type III secretion protein [Anaerohalosphaera sp.]
SEFYGAMDGASKFIRGDAKAGLIITAINITGGIAIGYSKGMDIVTAMKTYSVLSIGDGLVSQIPAIVISISSGFLVTKISSRHSVGKDLSNQFLKASQPLIIAAVIIAAMAFVPGMPKLAFIALAAGTVYLARVSAKAERAEKENNKDTDTGKLKPQKQPIEELLETDRISVNVGVRIISMIDPAKNSAIFDRIGSLRRRFAQDFGMIVPLVRLRDSVTMKPTEYVIKLRDHVIAKGQLEPDMFLAMDPGTVERKIEGIPTTEPVYGLPAIWISNESTETAELAGYTVIDPESVFITHLSETLKKHAHELLTREDVQQLVERLRTTQPSLVGEVVGELVSVGLLQRILKNLLADSIPIKQLTTILETLGDNAPKTKNPEMLTELVRKSLARTITEMNKDANEKISAITLDPSLEHKLVSTVRNEKDTTSASIPAETALDMTRKIAASWKELMDMGLEKIVLLCDSTIRPHIAATLRKVIPQLPIVAYDEIITGTQVEPMQTITLNQPELTAALPAK